MQILVRDIGKIDINDIEELPEFDMLCIGFPCFTFRYCGKETRF